MEYKDKLLNEKIESMNQNDRIELLIISNNYKNRLDTNLIMSSIFYTSSIIIFIFSAFLFLLNSLKLNILGIICAILGFLFIFVFWFAIFVRSKIEKQSKEKFEEIMERGKSKR
jgi:hypothetical protein